METNRNGYQGGGQNGRSDWMEGQGRGQEGRGGADRGAERHGGMSQGRMGQDMGRMGQDMGRMGQDMGRMGQGDDMGRGMGQGNDMGRGMGQGRMGQDMGRGDDMGRMGQDLDRGMMGQRERGQAQSGRRTRWQRESMTARDIMSSPVRSVNKQSTIKDVAQIMKDENVGIVPVVDEGRKLVGVVTDRDLVVRALTGGDGSAASLKIEDVMTDDVEAVAPDEELREVIELMGKKQVRRIPVVDEDDTLLGIIAMGDIANRADYDEELQDALEQISARRSFWNRRWL